MRKEKRDELRRLHEVEMGSSIHLTYAGRHEASRKALGGKPIIPPEELFISLGGDPDHFDHEALRECRRQLKAHGYKRDEAIVGFFGHLEEVWVRTERWPEDSSWRGSAGLPDLDAWIESQF